METRSVRAAGVGAGRQLGGGRLIGATTGSSERAGWCKEASVGRCMVVRPVLPAGGRAARVAEPAGRGGRGGTLKIQQLPPAKVYRKAHLPVDGGKV